MSDRDEGLEHAWQWFAHHSQQRFTTMNFFTVIAAAILAGSAALLKDGLQVACAFLGASLALMSIVFFLMDRRARRLIKIGEDALVASQASFATSLNNPQLNLVATSNKRVPGEFTYSQLLILMYGLFFLAGMGLSFNMVLFPEIKNTPDAAKPATAAPAQTGHQPPARK